MNSDISPKLGALALTKSLFPHMENQQDLDELLLYPPDLFAFTSLIFSATGAYRLIVSPPREISHVLKLKAGEVWMPEKNENDEYYWKFDITTGADIKDLPGLVNQLSDKDHKISGLILTRDMKEEIGKIKVILDEPVKRKAKLAKNPATNLITIAISKGKKKS